MTTVTTPNFIEISRLLKYEPDTGKLFWLPRALDVFTDKKQDAGHNCAIWNGRYAGKEAFTADDGYGYLQGVIFGRRYAAHRVIWLLHTGNWPTQEIDHINGDRSDNRISNLRVVSHGENLKNMRFRRSSASGVNGVHWDARRRKWRAEIGVEGRTKHLGRFDELADAAAARKQAEQKYQYHPNHGRA